jgi:hypothetical protein
MKEIRHEFKIIRASALVMVSLLIHFSNIYNQRYFEFFENFEYFGYFT